MSIRILIVEDEPLIARNLQQMLTAQQYHVTGIAYDQLTALDKLAQRETDLVLLDINLNGKFAGIEIAETIHTVYHLPFIFITSYADPATLEQAKQYQPAGYIVKPFEENEIYAAIEIAWHNYIQKGKEVITIEKLNRRLMDPLTNKEFAVLLELVKGMSYQEIADAHFVSINTVNSHVKKIYSKLGVHSRMEAMKFLRPMR
jgi:DNA-binding NarL/FixJ family response regulator